MKKLILLTAVLIALGCNQGTKKEYIYESTNSIYYNSSYIYTRDNYYYETAVPNIVKSNLTIDKYDTVFTGNPNELMVNFDIYDSNNTIDVTSVNVLINNKIVIFESMEVSFDNRYYDHKYIELERSFIMLNNYPIKDLGVYQYENKIHVYVSFYNIYGIKYKYEWDIIRSY